MDKPYTLQTVTVLGLLPHHVKHRINQLRSLGVVPLGPVVSGAGLSKDEVIGSENGTNRTRPECVHCARFEIHQHGAGHVAAPRRLVEVDIDALELLRRVAGVAARAVDPVLFADHLPELGADLVAALATLDVQDLAHFGALDRDRLGICELGGILGGKGEEVSRFIPLFVYSED